MGLFKVLILRSCKGMCREKRIRSRQVEVLRFTEDTNPC